MKFAREVLEQGMIRLTWGSVMVALSISVDPAFDRVDEINKPRQGNLLYILNSGNSVVKKYRSRAFPRSSPQTRVGSSHRRSGPKKSSAKIPMRPVPNFPASCVKLLLIKPKV